MQKSLTLSQNRPLRFAAKVLVNEIFCLYYNYDAEAIAAIQKIQQAYTKFCLNTEKDHSSSTLSKSDDESEDRIPQQELPLYFCMNADGRQPYLRALGFAPNDQARDFETEIRKTPSNIQTIIIEITSSICKYQEQRVGRRIDGKGYSYDPINLFLEEFKVWLTNLAHSPLDETTLQVVIQRQQYLEYLVDELVFSIQERKITSSLRDALTRSNIRLEINDFSAMQLIAKMIENISETMIPIIKKVIEKQRAREHFEALSKNTEIIARDGLKYLFYVFRDTQNVTKNINIGTIRFPEQPEDKQCIENTTSGRLLQSLSLTPEFYLISPIINPSQTSLVARENKSSEMLFLTREFDSCLAPSITDQLEAYSQKKDSKIKIQIHKYNWFDHESTNQVSGVLKNFREKQIMNDYLMALGMLQFFGLLKRTSDLLADLAGDGGEILIFGYLLTSVNKTINAYEKCLDTFEKILKSFKAKTQNYQITLIERQKLTAEDKAWFDKRTLTADYYNNILKSTQLCRDYLRKINIRISVVHDKSYLEKMKETINELEGLVSQFPTSQLTLSNNNLLTSSPSHPRTIATTTANNRPMRISNGSNFFGPSLQPRKMLPNEFDNACEEASKAYDQNQIDEASSLYKDLLKQKVDDCNLRLKYSLVLIAKGNEKSNIKAIQVLDLLIEQELGNPTAEQLVNAHFYRAIAKECINKIEGSFDDLTRAAAIAKQNDIDLDPEFDTKFKMIHERYIAHKEIRTLRG